MGIHRHPSHTRQGLSQEKRLIEPSRSQPASMQRHRHQPISIFQRISSGTHHPAPKRCYTVGPSGMFQAQHHGPARGVVDKDRARAPKGLRPCDTGRTVEAIKARMIERHAAGFALRPINEMHLPPVRRTQLTGAQDRVARDG